MRQSIYIAVCAVVLCCMVACDGEEPRQQAYTLSGSLWQDSLSAGEVMLYTGCADQMQQHELPVTNGAFSYQGETQSICELTLAYNGHTIHFYATPEAEIALLLDSAGQVTWSGNDTINGWLADHQRVLETMKAADCRKYVDSVCHLSINSIRSTLLLREQMRQLNDSLFVRRCLGSLSEEAKPAWLREALDEQFDRLSTKIGVVHRLPRTTLQLSNDSTFGLLDSRQSSLLLFFWTDYDSASVDSLHLMKQIARDYGLYEYGAGWEKEKSPTKSKKRHKVELISVCLNAADSASWRAAIDSLPGKHTWLKGGFAHPLPAYYKISTVPTNLTADRFSNSQGVNKWGATLSSWLESTPAINPPVKQQNKR